MAGGFTLQSGAMMRLRALCGLLVLSLGGLGCTRPALTGSAAASPRTAERFPFQVRDGQSGQVVAPTELAARLAAAQVVYAGEQHDSPAAHAVQQLLLEALYAQNPSVGVGVEMLPRNMQAALDDYTAGRSDEAAFLKAVDWPKTWGFDFALYRPLFAFCRAHRLRMFALNAPRSLTRALRKDGVAGLPPTERALLPDGYPWPAPEEHRAALRTVFDQHPHPAGKESGPPDPAAREAAFERFYLAQQLWDESMAQAVAEALAGPGAPRQVLVLAGGGHVGRHAIPPRAARRGVTRGLSVLPVAPGETPSGADAVDLLVDGRDPR